MSQGGIANDEALGEVIAWTTPAPASVSRSRWAFDTASQVKKLNSSSDEHVISLCLRATKLELRAGADLAFDGIMRAGAAHISGPDCHLTAHIEAPCDILHLHVPTRLIRDRLSAIGAPAEALDSLRGRTLSDALVEQLAKLLVTNCATQDPVYTMAIAQTLLTRILHMAQSRASVGALPKWRLRRVQMLIDERLAEPLTLSNLAAAAGLSRMHFASQFRAATGSSPHEYLLCRRIEAAKTLLASTQTSLAEIALEVGFLAQAHFTTVFKRLAGATPAQWRRAHHEVAQRSSELTTTKRKIEPWIGTFQGSRT